MSSVNTPVACSTFATNAAILRLMPIPNRSGRPGDLGTRIKELRERAGITSQKLLAKRLGWSQQKVSSIERGRSRLNTQDARELAAVLGCSVQELMTGTSRSVPVELVVAAFESKDRPVDFDLPAPHEMIEAPRQLADPDECFVADVIDRTIDRLYPPGSTLFIRRIPPTGGKLKIGSEVLIRRYATTKAEGQTLDVLVGLLQRDVNGALSVLIETSDRKLQGSQTIQEPPPSFRTLGERTQAFLTQQPEVDYRATPDDKAEILGEVVYATMPRLRASA